MAVAKVSKILLACHKSEKEELLSSLQKKGIVHITKVKEAGRGEEKEFFDLINACEEVIAYLEGIKPEERKKVAISLEEFTVKEDLPSLVQKVKGWKEEVNSLAEKEKEIDQELAKIKPLASLPSEIEDLYSLEKFEVALGFFPTPKLFIEAKGEEEKRGFYLKEISRSLNRVYALVLFPKEKGKEVREFLSGKDFTPIDLRKFSGTIEKNIERLNSLKEEMRKKREELAKEMEKLTSFLPQLKIGADYYQNVKVRREIENHLHQTKSSVVIEGWVKERDYKTLFSLVSKFPTAVLTRIKPELNEEPPVALENKRIFQPFEMVVNLYGMPSYQEIDPTPYLTPFFIIFFALCLSDAGYGLITLFLSLLLLGRLKRMKNFLILLAICSGFTIGAGAITNSWFGDILERLAIPFLKTFKDRLVLFDPFQNPLTFFYLSLALGYIHLNYGLLLEIYDSFRIRNPLPTLFNEGFWLILLNSLLSFFLLGKTFYSLKPIFISLILVAAAGLITLSRFHPNYLSRHLLFFSTLSSFLLSLGFRLRYFKILFLLLFLLTIFFSLMDNRKKLTIGKLIPYCLAFATFLLYMGNLIPAPIFLALGVGSIFLSPINRQLVKKLIWGAYNLYGGTSFIGIILSYIRLMALGMMTAGIGMAVNSIAWMVKGIPALGIILTLFVLLIGHTYNIAVSILGAFVHTLRLNYVEFFPRFFTGGGKRFSPFKLETKYVEIK
ncbi:MAG: V-type ATP synthase subunit I [candidate division WOR-3 bacterium]